MNSEAKYNNVITIEKGSGKEKGENPKTLRTIG